LLQRKFLSHLSPSLWHLPFLGKPAALFRALVISYNQAVDLISTTRRASITVIRHGEPIGGTRYRGSTNDPLSPLGWQQMHATNLAVTKWDNILSSPLLRCIDFARHIAKSQQTPVAQVAGFEEINFGEWEGKTAAELYLHEPDNFAIYLNNPLRYTPPNAESLIKFSQRVVSAWENVLKLVQAGEKILLVTHGGTIRVILHHVLGLPLSSIMKIHVPFACVSKIYIDLPLDYSVACRLAYHAAHREMPVQ